MHVEYLSNVESMMKKLYQTLSEKDQRHYAGAEAYKLGHGGITYISALFGCDRDTVSKGIEELKALPDDCGYEPRIRRAGGGRKPYSALMPEIDTQFLETVTDYTAGDPMNENKRWTNLQQEEISDLLKTVHKTCVSRTVIRQLLKKHDYRRRKAQKKQTMKQVKHRNEQFENIARLKAEFKEAGHPIISIDTKKKEWLGNFYRNGHLYTTQEIKTFDHDFNGFAEGVIIPHGIYDLMYNDGFINIGLSHDTAEFVADCIRQWWKQIGSARYPNAPALLALCDGGGSNNSRHYVFKEQLQNLAVELGLEIRIAHYPPYTSKYNPIEHRLFPHVTKACQGVIFESVDIVKQLIGKTKTKMGLKVMVNVIEKIYQTGKKTAANFKENMKIVFDEYLPKWNYRALPTP